MHKQRLEHMASLKEPPKKCENAKLLHILHKIHKTAQTLGYKISEPTLWTASELKVYGVCLSKGRRVFLKEKFKSFIVLNENFVFHPQSALVALIHEYGHALYPKNHHGRKWKRATTRIGKKLGVQIPVKSTSEKMGFSCLKN